MDKKLFVVSDVHGYYTELMQALEQAGFDKNNEQHIFVSCGDLFDRGKDSPAVYDFVRGLPRKILIKGNHEDMLYTALKNARASEPEVWNGTNITITQLIGEDSIDEDGYLNVARYSDKIEELKSFIESMLDYFETENYILTHGWLPIDFEGRRPYIVPTWREATEEDWERARWLEWQQLYNVGAVPEDKTIVCGHRPVWLSHVFDMSREPDCSQPFYGKGLIAIDAGTVRSHRVNVLVIEDEDKC